MKNLAIAMALILTMCQTEAQKLKSSDVPAVVKSSFEKSFTVSRVAWEKEDANFEASFKADGKEVSVVLDGTGNILETETEIKKGALPQAVLAALANEYKDYEVEEAAKIEAAGVITYEVEVEQGKKTFELIFDATGKLLKKEEVSDDED